MKMNLNDKSESIIMSTSFDKIIDELSKTHNYFIIDQNVYNLYHDFIQSLPNKIGESIIIADEANKTIETYNQIIKDLLKHNVTKKDYLVAIGGGIITDLAGFTASTYKRGMNLINIPTTLIGMIDASIGGKNGLNVGKIKNVIGQIYLPNKVLICSSFLETLDPIDITCGKIEMFKIALVFDDAHIKYLKGYLEDNIIKYFALKKENVCFKDLEGNNIRTYLNFGHTLGHALELTLNIKHGIAVGLGMYYFTKSKELKAFIKDHLFLYGLNILDYQERIKNLNIDELMDIISNDKKNDDLINIVTINEINEPYIESLTKTELRGMIENELL